MYARKAFVGEISVIWIAHISMDRLLGFGLKYPGSFKFTHFQAVANRNPPYSCLERVLL